MRTARAATLIAVTDLRRRLRNRSLVLQAFVGPLLLATIISLAFGGGISFDVEVGVVDADRSELATAFQDRLVKGSGEGVSFVAVDDLDGAQAPAVVVPAGFEASLSSNAPLPVGVLTDQGNAVGSAVARSVATALTARVDAARLGVAGAVAAGRPAPGGDVLARIDLPVTLERRDSVEGVSPAAHFGPGMGLLFLFLTVGMVARGLIEERQQCVLDRIRAAPVPTSAILAGRCASLVVISSLSLLVIWAATTVLLGADWGDPLGVSALIVASALAVAGVAGIVASVARTEQGADSLATMLAFTLSLVGGNMLPLADLPDGLRRLSLLTPNGWSLQGFAELSAGQGSVGDVALHLAVLTGWAVVLGGVSAVALPRRLGMR